MTKYFPILLLALASCRGTEKQEIPLTFRTTGGQVRQIFFDSLSRGVIYIFILPDCPMSQFYSMTVNQIYSMYVGKGYQFYGIVPGTLYANAEIDSFKSQQEFLPEILIDPGYRLTEKLGVKVVPQAVFTDTKGRILYSGKIDDQAIQTGLKKYIPTHFYLLDAVKFHAAGLEIAVKSTTAVGCYIEGEYREK